jgi:hypothetical protein
MPTCYPNTGLILQKIFGRKLVSRESIGKLMMGSTRERIQDFKLGGGVLKKIVPSGGRREIFGVFRVNLNYIMYSKYIVVVHNGF